MILTVFESRLNPAHISEYEEMAKEMVGLAVNMPGYVFHRSYKGEDYWKVTIVAFEDEASLDAWRRHPDHLRAKRAGRDRLFTDFSYQICTVTKSQEYKSKARPAER